ncbi:MAG: DoxX family protein [bacterium]
MNKKTNLLELYAPAVLRIGMAVVILWFSLQQFLHNSFWTAYIPDSIVALTHLGAPTLVMLNAIFELVFGLALVFGLYTRISALLLALHLFDIMWVVGYGDIGVRDLGLAIGTLVVFMNGPDIFCVLNKKRDLQKSLQRDSQF